MFVDDEDHPSLMASEGNETNTTTTHDDDNDDDNDDDRDNDHDDDGVSTDIIRVWAGTKRTNFLFLRPQHT